MPFVVNTHICINFILMGEILHIWKDIFKLVFFPRLESFLKVY